MSDPATPTGDAEISEILAWLRREQHGHAMAHEERHMSDIEVYRSQERAHRYRQAADAIERLTRATPPQPAAAPAQAVDIVGLNPPEPGIYPVTLAGGTRTCARWDGTEWSVWTEVFDPPEWDPVVCQNSRVIAWRKP